MGLGAMVGTGVFVSIGIAAGIAGPAVVLAIVIAAGVAACNGLSSAQLAASHSVSGGTYEYGYKYLTPVYGFTAGWMFLVAKAASAATAALGFSGYLIHLFGLQTNLLIPIALAAVIILTLIVLSGMRRSNQVNILIVSITLLSLIFFVITGFLAFQPDHFTPFLPVTVDGTINIQSILFATALMFVAYTGYGRIATLGEEVHQPKVTIPRAIILTMAITMILYITVAVAGISFIGAGGLADATDRQAAPLSIAAGQSGIPGAAAILSAGAITAMLGVLLNLILGLSRVLLAMGRRNDLPSSLALLNKMRTTPYIAVSVTGLGIAGLVLIGDVKTTWSFSAFTVLIYYAITNLAALKIGESDRLYPKWVAMTGLGACLFLAFWVETQTWAIGLLLIVAGLGWFAIVQKFKTSSV